MTTELIQGFYQSYNTAVSRLTSDVFATAQP